MSRDIFEPEAEENLSVADFYRLAIAEAKRTGSPIRTRYNGLIVWVDPQSFYDDLSQIYLLKMNLKQLGQTV